MARSYERTTRLTPSAALEPDQILGCPLRCLDVLNCWRKSADTSAGQRAAMEVLSKRLRKFLSSGNPHEVMSAMETCAGSIEPPASRSEEWKRAFRLARSQIVSHLKRVHAKGGLRQVDHELRLFSKSLSDLETKI